MQLRRLAALERQRIIDELAEIEAEIAELQRDPRQRGAAARRSSREELAEIVEKYGDERRTQIVAAEGEMSMEDLIAEEDVVVTITRGGYAKRTKADLYRSQRRGGKGVRGAAAARGRHRRPLLRDDDPPLDPVLHQQGPRLPRQGLRAARGRPRRQGPARRQPAGVPARRAHRAGPRPAQLRGVALPRARHQATAWSRRPAHRLRLPAPAAASSPSTCATATS